MTYKNNFFLKIITQPFVKQLLTIFEQTNRDITGHVLTSNKVFRFNDDNLRR